MNSKTTKTPISPADVGKAFLNKPSQACAVAALLFLTAGVASGATLPYENEYAFGVDASFVKSRLEQGREYRDAGETKHPLAIFRDHGYNWARVHLCNEPVPRLPQTLDYVIASGQAIKEHGMKFHLDLMFTNGWANPRLQPTPSLWEDMTHEQRIEAVYEFCRDTITALRDAGAMPDMVQVGNEIGNGFLWPAGRLYPEQDQPSNWSNVADYLKAGIKGIREAAGDETVDIMVHVHHGGDVPLTVGFYDQLKEHGVEYDVIGLSFYPWSHGTLTDLEDNLHTAALRYNKPIIVVETGYYFEPSRYFENFRPPFPETPEGQREWLKTVNEIVMRTPNRLGRGIFWWEPMMGGRGYFDADGNAMPVVEALEHYALPLSRPDGNSRL